MAKNPPVRLSVLVSEGLIRDGERLCLRDYAGETIPAYEAAVEGDKLRWHDGLYSMSELARLGFNSMGNPTTSFRGPAHWYTEDESILHMWTRRARLEEF